MRGVRAKTCAMWEEQAAAVEGLETRALWEEQAAAKTRALWEEQAATVLPQSVGRHDDNFIVGVRRRRGRRVREAASTEAASKQARDDQRARRGGKHRAGGQHKMPVTCLTKCLA